MKTMLAAVYPKLIRNYVYDAQPRTIPTTAIGKRPVVFPNLFERILGSMQCRAHPISRINQLFFWTRPFEDPR